MEYLLEAAQQRWQSLDGGFRDRRVAGAPMMLPPVPMPTSCPTTAPMTIHQPQKMPLRWRVEAMEGW